MILEIALGICIASIGIGFGAFMIIMAIAIFKDND